MRNAEFTRQLRDATAGLDRSLKGIVAHDSDSNRWLRPTQPVSATYSYVERGNPLLHVATVSTKLASVLKQARKRLKLSQQQVADAIGVSRPAVGQWESGEKEPSTGNLIKATQVLEIDLGFALQGEMILDTRPPELRALSYVADELVEVPLPKVRELPKEEWGSEALRPNVRAAPMAPIDALNAQYYLPLDVPVLGVTVGGVDHDFQFNGDTVDYVRRPPGIASAKKAYATFVVGDSMYPAFAEGALVYVNPDKPPSIGDDVVIELIHEDTSGDQVGDQAGKAFIKRLVKRTPNRVVVMQFNPPQEIEFERQEVKAMHRVVPWNELLGI